MKLYSKKIVALGILAALVVGACGDDEPSKAPSSCNNNNTVDGDETCDGTAGIPTCTVATMGSSPTGMVKCTTSCTLDTTGCTGSSGAGGGSGTGGSGS